MPAAIQLVVGLANPGAEYEATRHNAGAWVVDALCQMYHASLTPEKKFFGLSAKMRSGANNVHLLVPSTFMNNSGQAIHALAHFYKIPINAILVVHDELDLPAGQVKLKSGGGHAGHNGLRSTIQALGSADFWRLRIGIGHPGQREKVTGYVLSAPSKTDRSLITQSIEATTSIFDNLFCGDFEAAMRRLHTKE